LFLSEIRGAEQQYTHLLSSSKLFETRTREAMRLERKLLSSFRPLLSLTIALAIVSFQTSSSCLGAQAFGILRTSYTPSVHQSTRLVSPQSTARKLSNNNDDNGKQDSGGLLDLDLLARRLEKADTTEMRNDATLVACYVLCRFLVYDVTSGAKIEPGWQIQDWIWLTGTFSSATVLVVYFVIAGLLSRTYESNTTFAAFGPSPVIRALVNVVLCCPVWLATEHLLGFGPADIGGDTLAMSVATGFVGLGSFMALAKVLTAGIK